MALGPVNEKPAEDRVRVPPALIVTSFRVATPVPAMVAVPTLIEPLDS